MQKKIMQLILLFASVSVFNLSCKKEPGEYASEEEYAKEERGMNDHNNSKPTKRFSSELVVKWLNVQLDMLRVPLAAGTGSQSSDRAQAYCGITIYEAVVKGMPEYNSLKGQLVNFPAMPSTEKGKTYHWAASGNAALAEINRKLFPTTSAANKARIDSLENALQNVYASQVNAITLQRSISYGKEIANRVYNWASTDGFANINPPYIPPFGPGLWVPTAPTPPINPYASQHRLLVPGVANGTAMSPPPYSPVAGSAFWNMAKGVYDKSFVLTPDQISAAIYHRDAPGYPGGGHFVAILSQTLSKDQSALDVAALAYAKVGLAQHDATAILFTAKYTHNVLRPVTYIQNEMKHPEWQPLIPTPNHPEFPSGHATINGSVLTMMTDVFGKNFNITLHTYDYLGMAPRSYSSFEAMGKEMADSRVWGGIHYQATCDRSRVQGKKIAQNILKKIEFLKDHHHGHDHGHGHD